VNPFTSDPEELQVTSGATSEVPFSVVDEAVHLLDSKAAPWSIQLEARVAGRLDEARLRDAFGRALAVHPMARARKAAASRHEHTERWEIPAEVEVDPLRAVDCADDDAVARVREQLQGMAVPLAESPPLRARLLHNPDGDLVMLNANHAAMDALGAMRLLRSVASAYADESDPGPGDGPDPIAARTRLDELIKVDGRTRARRRLALAEKLTDVVLRPARVAPEGASGGVGYGFHHVSLPAPLTSAVVGLRHQGTVNDVLLAALNLAIAEWNECRGEPCGRIGVLVPANLRPAGWRHDVVGNFSLPARVSTSRRQRRRPEAALRALTAQTRRKKTVGLGTALLEVLPRSDRLPLWAKQAMVMSLPLGGNRLVDTAMLSNLGPIPDPPSFGPDAGPTVEAWFSPPGRMPLGLTVGALTIQGRLHLAFRYRHRLFDADAARRFADVFVGEVVGLVERTSTTPLAS